MHRRCSLPLVLIKTKWQRKKNGENRSSFDDFRFFSLTFFSIKSLFLGLSRDPWDHSPQTDFRPATTGARSRLLQQSGDTKKNGENLLCFDDFKFFYSPFFQINFYFWGYRAIRDITAHSWSFAQPPPPSAPVYYNKEATQNKWCETFLFWRFYIFFTHLFFN